MAKKKSLTDALEHAAKGWVEDSIPQERGPSPDMPPSRHGKKVIAGHFDPVVSRQLREIALAEDTTVQALLREALNDLFQKRGRPPIA